MDHRISGIEPSARIIRHLVSSFPGTMLRIPPLGRFSSPTYRGIIWQWQWVIVWPAEAPIFMPDIIPVRFEILNKDFFRCLDEVEHCEFLR